MYHKWQSYYIWFLRYQLQQTDFFLSSWAIFCSFTLLTPQKLNRYIYIKKMKIPGDIIILHRCTKTHDYRLCCSWDMVYDGCNCCFSFWAIFYPFNPRKMKNSKKRKRTLAISSVYTSVPKTMIICYTVLEIRSVTDVIVVFPFYPTNSPKNENLNKMKKKKTTLEASSF